MGLSTHVLDTATGRPAVGLPVRLERAVRTLGGTTKGWLLVTETVTDSDGRVADLPLTVPGPWRLVFDTASRSAFFPEVTVAFAVEKLDGHHHIPLLLAPFSYSTYLGS